MREESKIINCIPLISATYYKLHLQIAFHSDIFRRFVWSLPGSSDFARQEKNGHRHLSGPYIDDRETRYPTEGRIPVRAGGKDDASLARKDNGSRKSVSRAVECARVPSRRGRAN